MHYVDSYYRGTSVVVLEARQVGWGASGRNGGSGMGTTTVVGELVASAIADKDDRYRLFAPFGLTPTGGSVGVAAAQLTYWAYQLRDGLRERLITRRQSS